MHPIAKLKLNKFQLCKLPKPCELFARYGYGSHVDRNMTGDTYQPQRESKAQTLHRLNKEMFEEDA